VKGNITRRGKHSWRLKFDDAPDPVTGKRRTRFVTVKGKRQDAERELARLITATADGTFVEPSEITVGAYFSSWLANPHGLAPKTAERYRGILANQIVPHLGGVALQKLRPAHLVQWHAQLRAAERPLSPATILYCHRVLHRGLERALEAEMVARNVARIVRPPGAPRKEVTVLKTAQLDALFEVLRGHSLETIATLAVQTGARRGELLALRWADLSSSTLRIERSLEQTAAGLRFKLPKTQSGVRTIALSATAVEALRAHRVRQLEHRTALGQGKPEPDALVFCTADGSPIAPNDLSRQWHMFVRSRGMPLVTFHSLRHVHASVLIAAKVNTLMISKRLGHSGPGVTLTVYGHLMDADDSAAAEAIEAFLKR
jgi:integrase